MVGRLLVEENQDQCQRDLYSKLKIFYVLLIKKGGLCIVFSRFVGEFSGYFQCNLLSFISLFKKINCENRDRDFPPSQSGGFHFFSISLFFASACVKEKDLTDVLLRLQSRRPRFLWFGNPVNPWKRFSRSVRCRWCQCCQRKSNCRWLGCRYSKQKQK
jgi:hypothetical protein